MTAELHIGTLRLHGRSSDVRRLDARTAVEALDLAAATDRRVLVVRRLQVTANDPDAARLRLAELRRKAAHPALGEVDPRADAVEFSDEAEALLCLSADVVCGCAADRWWWSGKLPSHTRTPAETLVVLWTARPRWVPEVLSSWLSTQPRRAVEALSILPPAGAELVLDAVLANYVPAAVRRTRVGGGDQGPARLQRAATLAPYPADVALDVPPARVAAARQRVAQRLGPLVGERLAAPSYALLAAAVVLAEQPSWAATPEFIAWLELERSETSATSPVALGMAPEGTPDEQQDESSPAAAVTPIRPVRPNPPPEGDQEPSWQQRPWAGGGPSTETGLATMLYAVNLVRWFDLTRLGSGATGWSVVEAVARWLLRGLPAGRRRALLSDPLLPLLAQLDGRPDGVPTPVRLGNAIRPALRFLRSHDLATTTFTQPGTVFVSRTHVDVVLDIHQIDLAARTSGLDQDPGWIPELGRVVLFHFEGAP